MLSNGVTSVREKFTVLISILKKNPKTNVTSSQLEEITAQLSPRSLIRPSRGHISNQAVIITGMGFMIPASTITKA